MSEQQRLEAAIANLQSQRALLGDPTVDAALGPMKARLAAIAADTQAGAAGGGAESVRLVTVLFADIVGSTQIAQRLDAEDMLELSSQSLARLSAVVQRHGGRVLRYTGDGLKALFGADSVSEDDAERAVRCGLAMQSAARTLAADWRARCPDAEFAIRVGIHTGPVALGGGVEGGATAMGGTVNLAARMEQAGPPGAVRISHDTLTHVRGLFDDQEQPPLTAKGIAEPVRSHLVLRARPRSMGADSRGILGVTTAMIGRDAELDALKHAVAKLFDRPQAAVVSVVADAGLGKSRLRRAFEAWLADQPRQTALFRGRATARTQVQPFGLLRDILAAPLRIADDDSVETARRKVEQAIVPLFLHDDGADLAEGHAHLLGHLVGIDWRDSRHLRDILDDPQQIRQRALHAAAQVVRRIAAAEQAPLLLVLEDLQWADDESLDFLDDLIAAHHDAAMLTLAFSRAMLFERRPDWPRAGSFHQRLSLQPLDATCSRRLADALLHRLTHVPVALRKLVIGGAEGNPFYMEELVNMLIDQGAIRTGDASSPAWAVDVDRLGTARVPATLTGVLQARLDGLPHGERLALQQASVIGPVFRDRELAALDAAAPHNVPALLQRELAVPHGTAAAEATTRGSEYAFKHQVLHQVTYGTVLKRNRRAWHGQLAQWMAQQTGLRAYDLLGVIAGHFEQAGDDAAAAEFHARAADHAGTRLAHGTVREHVQRAYACLDRAGDDPRLRWRLLDVHERSCEVRGDRDGQRAGIEALHDLAESLDDEALRAHAALRRAVMAQRLADWPACERAGRTGMLCAARAGDDVRRLLCQRLVAFSMSKRGELAAGEAMVQAGLQEARTLGLRTVASVHLNALAVIAGMRADPVAALGHAREYLAVARETGNRRGEAVGWSAVGCGRMDLGDLARASQDLTQSLRLVRANGDRVIEGATLCSLSTAALWQGNAEAALALAQSALDTASAVGARDLAAIALSKRGNAELALGLLDAASQSFERARQGASAVSEPVRHDATAGLARVALARGDSVAASGAIGDLLDHLATGGTLDGVEDMRRIELTCHQVLGATGQQAEAAAWLARAEAGLQRTARTITDDGLRESFMQAIPVHREIVEAARTWHAPGA